MRKNVLVILFLLFLFSNVCVEARIFGVGIDFRTDDLSWVSLSFKKDANPKIFVEEKVDGRWIKVHGISLNWTYLKDKEIVLIFFPSKFKAKVCKVCFKCDFKEYPLLGYSYSTHKEEIAAAPPISSSRLTSVVWGSLKRR